MMEPCCHRGPERLDIARVRRRNKEKLKPFDIRDMRHGQLLDSAFSLS